MLVNASVFAKWLSLSVFRHRSDKMSKQARLIEYLEQEMGLPEDAIALGLRQAGALPNLLPIALWKYGFVTADQLEQIFDWLETLQPGQNLM